MCTPLEGKPGLPELPEVETVRRGLVPVMEDVRILCADIRRPDLRWPFPPDMSARLTGVRVKQLRRRSKYILADLDTGETLIIHLGMSGRMLISGGAAQAAVMPGRFRHTHPMPGKHDHVVLDMEGGVRITFNDVRRFGSMDLTPTDRLEDHWLIAPLGPEPLGSIFSDAYLAARFMGHRTPVKSALLDQRIVAGLGNIYVCEALYRAGISPKRQVGRISRPRLARLALVIRDVIAEAIKSGGSSLRDYRRADGDIGYFQHNFRVYDREGAPCPKPGCAGAIRRIVQSGRSTFYCASCQR